MNDKGMNKWMNEVWGSVFLRSPLNVPETQGSSFIFNAPVFPWLPALVSADSSHALSSRGTNLDKAQSQSWLLRKQKVWKRGWKIQFCLLLRADCLDYFSSLHWLECVPYEEALPNLQPKMLHWLYPVGGEWRVESKPHPDMQEYGHHSANAKEGTEIWLMPSGFQKMKIMPCFCLWFTKCSCVYEGLIQSSRTLQWGRPGRQQWPSVPKTDQRPRNWGTGHQIIRGRTALASRSCNNPRSLSAPGWPLAQHIPDGSWEQDRILRNDRELGPQVLQANAADVHTIDENSACCGLHQAEKSHTQGGLTCWARNKQGFSFLSLH